MQITRSKQTFALVVLLLWALAAQGVFSGSAIYNQVKTDQQTRWPFFLESYSTTVERILPEYRDSGIQHGDELIELEGKPIEGEETIAAEQAGLRAGMTLMIKLRRSEAGRTNTFTVPLVLKPSAPQALGWIFTIGVLVVLPLFCLLVGFYIAFARPRDPLAWITMAMLASFGQIYTGHIVSLWSLWSPWRELLLIYRSLLGNTWPLWMLLFALYFPRPFEFLRGRRWLLALLCALPCVLAGLDIYGSLTEGEHLADLKWLHALELKLTLPQVILFTVYICGFFACLAIKRGQLRASPDASRRLRVMVIGCSMALIPLLPFVLAEIGVMHILPPWLAVLCLLMLFFFPLTIAYVIVVQRAMEVRMVLRSGLRYALASTGIQILRALLVVGIVMATIHFVQQSEHRAEGVIIIATGGAAVVLLSRLARWVGDWIDRRFFREAYNTERILMELGSSVAGIRDTKRLMETVVQRIAASLHIPRVAFLLEQGGSFQPAYALGFKGPAPAVQISEQASTIRTLKRLNGPSKVYFDDPQSWVHGTSDAEQTALQRLETQVLLPVTLNTRMLGIISLGSKRSELPYSKADLQLLGAVAGQAGLALENAHLTESIRREVAQRERLDRELEIARDVQQRLFPQKLPLVKGLDFCGYCRPAQGVGGDYYDFIHLATGSLGIAVGDVSGKGIAAALMMASLQASLRGQTIKPSDTLSEMIHHINGLVYEASSANRYATFFYAQYDPLSRKLRYVNAGHNPPMLRRKTAEGSYEFLRLEEGGTVIGLFPDFPYKEAEIELQAGDVLVAFTDGISEAMNHAEEEFDEPRLMDAIRNCPNGTAATISSYILDHVDAFTAGADQHDDMTIVVVRLL
jgi:sigma-B regulation protein RsbU (phosphoserine phosphatase)